MKIAEWDKTYNTDSAFNGQMNLRQAFAEMSDLPSFTGAFTPPSGQESEKTAIILIFTGWTPI
jgi:hypothetical protein